MLLRRLNMELEGFKSVWQKRTVTDHSNSVAPLSSRTLQFVRTSALRDLQRSEELSRFIFCLLFACVALGASMVVLAPGAGRVAAWLFAAALLFDGVTGMALLTRRFHSPATSSILEFVSREHRLVEVRVRLERYSQWVVFILASIALLILLFAPRPADLHKNALDALERMVILTAFLAFAWRRAKSRSAEIRNDLEGCLRDLEK